MGYTTDFKGSFTLSKKLKEKHRVYLEKFCNTRRMKRNETESEKIYDPAREAVGLPVGKDGAYFVGATGFMGQDEDKSILDYNSSGSQPGLWCHWTPNLDGTEIEWDEGEKFYYYIEWLQYIIDHFLDVWGYKLNGTVIWWGESIGDTGKIIVKNNKITVKDFSKELEV